jgi:hypothetical protein
MVPSRGLSPGPVAPSLVRFVTMPHIGHRRFAASNPYPPMKGNRAPWVAMMMFGTERETSCPSYTRASTRVPGLSGTVKRARQGGVSPVSGGLT